MPGSRSGPPPCSRSPAPVGPPPVPSRWRCWHPTRRRRFPWPRPRLWFGLAVNAWTERRVFAWMYLVDVMLAPIGLLAALAGRDHALAVAAGDATGRAARDLRPRAPRAHRERTRARPPGGARSASGCTPLLRPRVGHDRDRRAGRAGSQSVTGAADALLGVGWEAEGPRAAHGAHPPRRRRGPHGTSSSAPHPARREKHARPSGACAHPTAPGAMSRASPPICWRTHACTGWP